MHRGQIPWIGLRLIQKVNKLNGKIKASLVMMERFFSEWGAKKRID